MDINLYGAVPDSIVDGPGLRYAVFVQGCSHACPGCHNPESQPREGGTLTTTDAVLADIRANGLVHDVTLSGGEPFEQAAACAHLARQLKEEGYGVWAYTGYLYEDLVRLAEHEVAVRELLDNVDVLVDGPFVQARKSLSLKWCGSSNQRLIDVAATRAAGRVVTWEPPSFVPQKPPSW
ncbi:anaerobic ribonucleoside-triphosphate reductase activating protein [Adlercreutzia sp. ZJ242]|uniref:anaerobic ribonucleoside-triphosphate reductase activating protein n=1 Tax=Adlercreutzia sp. ZJ242 TaxID=2709409 RepID=UPI0013EB2473|nr:anaerobic ribonucleoside-triphosphate reductase activating protein [Adlercreutzia sp. ZJ242]